MSTSATRLLSLLAVALPLACAGCATAPRPSSAPAASAPAASAPTSPAAAEPAPAPPRAAASAAPRTLAADTPLTTVEGNTFVGPSGWTVTVNGPATILEAPEKGSRLALVDVRAASADEAVRKAWAAYRPDAGWPLQIVLKGTDQDGWSDVQTYVYKTSPNERWGVSLNLRRAGDVWTATIYDMADPVGEKRGSQVALVLGELLPKGQSRETFKGRTAHALDAGRVAQLAAFVENARKELRVPGVAVGVIQGGKVVFADGFGERELGRGVKPDADTLFMIASNTKALTTLMLAKLVDEKKLAWDQPVTSVFPDFKLGDAETTRQVLVRHLICACTGLPRQDMEWLFQFEGVTPRDTLRVLGTMQPTSKFGELFQYSNMMAGAAGFVGGHVVDPGAELGAAYDEAMDRLVFRPLGMTATTFDFARALAAPHAGAYAPDVDGTPAPALMRVNDAVIPVRPAGGAWSSVNDVLKYVAMELAEGALPDGTRYISREALLARRAPQVAMSKTETYGMGLMVDTTYGTPVVHHGGDMIGYHSDMIWLPEHGVGAVVLTNGDPGWALRNAFRRRLLEVLFDGRPEAEARVAAAARNYFEGMASERKDYRIPADPAEAAKLADAYANDALGTLRVQRADGRTRFDAGEWSIEVASRVNPDGTVSFLSLAPGILGFEFVVGKGEAPARTLVVRDAQHEYVFTEQR